MCWRRSATLSGDVCFRLTDAGRYLLGLAEDFALEEHEAARVIVQPNFDVTFLAPAPAAEAEIARFAERKGRRLGVLFSITKRSVSAAAAAGLTAEAALEVLRQHCTGGVPANVAHEIAGWFALCRRVHIRRTVLLECPDAETAERLIGAAAGKVTRISADQLELHGGDHQPKLFKKLRELGIFVIHDERERTQDVLF